jgi:hypothetical protein
MSLADARLAVFASPERARSLFTVRAAVSAVWPVLSPRCFALALMCSYCRSRCGWILWACQLLPVTATGASSPGEPGYRAESLAELGCSPAVLSCGFHLPDSTV